MTSSSGATRRARFRNSTPAAYLRTMVEIAIEHGASEKELFQGTYMSMALLENPDLRIAARDAANVMYRAVQLTGKPGLGLEFGLRARPTAHGYVGYAAMACETLREAWELVIRYVHLRQRDLTISLTEDDGAIALTATDNHDLGAFRTLVHESMMVGFVRMAAFLLGRSDIEAQLWFDWPEPDYFAAYRDHLPAVRFNMPNVQLRIPRRYFDLPLIMADPVAVKKAVEQCEREMATTSPAAEKVLDRVRAELTPGTDGYPDLETVAACLFMSSRTLKRKLEARGTSYQQLMDEARYRDALQLLRNPDMDVQHIATALGYHDPPSFSRAFKRWSGSTPSQARKTLL